MGCHPAKRSRKRKRPSQEALELDDSLAEAHITLGNIESLYDHNWVRRRT